jgi:hypothetical protein
MKQAAALRLFRWRLYVSPKRRLIFARLQGVIFQKIELFMKIIIFWDFTPCTLVHTYKLFGGTFCICYEGNMEAAASSPAFIPVYQTTRCYIPEDCNLYNYHENPIFHRITLIGR